jgi:hypothetical protein|tara:strand:+ start:552 stop:830 length:279 start_codon:yes stop_codon:yes gene_type:complete
MWGEIFKDIALTVGKNLIKGKTSGGGGGPAGMDFDPVSFDKYDMDMFKAEGPGTIKQAKVNLFDTYRKFWTSKLLDYISIARAFTVSGGKGK